MFLAIFLFSFCAGSLSPHHVSSSRSSSNVHNHRGRNSCGYSDNDFHSSCVQAPSQAPLPWCSHQTYLSGPCREYVESPWLRREGANRVYKLRMFILDPLMNETYLRPIMEAHIANSLYNFAPVFNAHFTYEFRSAADFSNPAMFAGDWIPFIVSASQNTGYGFHAVQVSPWADSSSSYLTACSTLECATGGDHSFPPNSLPYFTPYLLVSSGFIRWRQETGYLTSSPYAFSANTPQDFTDFFSAVIGHEIQEVLNDDITMAYTMFDQYAPVSAVWRVCNAIASQGDNCTNAVLNVATGFYELPVLNSSYPLGFQMSIIREEGDPVGYSFAEKLQVYRVNGYTMPNFVLPSFWRPYQQNGYPYDFLGQTTLPMQPSANGGQHQIGFFTDSGNTGLTYLVDVWNFGVLNSSQRNRLVGPVNNFPPSYTIMRLLQVIAPSKEQSAKRSMAQETPLRKETL